MAFSYVNTNNEKYINLSRSVEEIQPEAGNIETYIQLPFNIGHEINHDLKATLYI